MNVELYNPANQQSFFDESQLEKLNRPLQTTRIKERKGFGGKLLKYLKADDVMGVANEIFGYGRWGYKVVARSEKTVEDRKKGFPIDIYTCDIELSVVGCPFTFPGDGVGVVNDPYTVEMHEKARKEATSDALKRALRHFGDQFGLCLYDEDDMVETPDGSMVSVKEAKPQKAPQPKRVVESTTKAALDNDTKQRLNKCFDDAKELELFTLGKTKDESAIAFFGLLTKILNVAISSPQDLTGERLDAVERYLSLEVEKRLGVPA